MNNEKESNKDGNIGAILGIIGMLLSCVVVGIIPAAFGLAYSIKGIKKTSMKRATSIIGIITSSLTIVWCVIMVIAVILGISRPDLLMDTTTTENTTTKQEATEENEIGTELLETWDEVIISTEMDSEYKEESESVQIDIDEKVDTSDTSQNEVEKKETDTEELARYSLDYLKQYLDEHGIKYYGDDVENKMKKLLSDSLEIMNIKIEDGGGLKEDYYALTSEDTDIFYIGKIKDNRPDGFGILFEGVYASIGDLEGTDDIYLSVDLNWEINAYHMIYAGNFNKGRYDGSGIKFVAKNTQFNGDDRDYSIEYNNIYIPNTLYKSNEGDVQSLVYKTAEPVIYCGEFKDGRYCGKGQEISYMGSYSKWDETNECEVLYLPDIGGTIVGEYDKGYADGKIKEYELGYLLYEGEVKKNKYHGEGTLYFYASNQVKYKGKFKNGVYNGKGTLYDENGNIVYKGKWKNGDYANK